MAVVELPSPHGVLEAEVEVRTRGVLSGRSRVVSPSAVRCGRDASMQEL